jgi:hypothetical protein
VASGYYILRLHYAGSVILAVEKTAISFLGARRRTLERYVPTLGADHYLLPLDVSPGDQDANRFSNRAFRALTSVIDGGVQQIYALPQGRNHSCRVAFVFGVIAFAEVGAETERGDQEAVGEGPIEMIDLLILEPFLKPECALCGSASLDERL